MEEETLFSDTNISIEPLSADLKEQVDLFSCGNTELDMFFHEEMFLCVKYHYISIFCAKIEAEIVAIFTLMNDAVVIDNIDKKDFISESGLKISEEYLSTF